MKTIIHVVDVKAPREQVYAGLTTQQGLAGWWTTRVNAEERVGGVVRFAFDQEFGPVMKIIQLQSPSLVAWECVGGHEYWMGNTFRFEVAGKDGGSRLRFRQDYSRELSDDQYGIYNYNWGYYLDSLRLLCETGNGKPFSPVK